MKTWSYYLGDHINEDKIGETCSMHGYGTLPRVDEALHSLKLGTG